MKVILMSETRIIVLVGGAGYIGTHLMLGLHGRQCSAEGARYQIAIIDQKDANKKAVEWAEKNANGLEVLKYKLDVSKRLEPEALKDINMPPVPYCGIMLAALKDINEGEERPYEYLYENFSLCVNSMELLTRLGVTRLIQASSSAVYHTITPGGEPVGNYGYTKRVSEDICRRLLRSNQSLLVARYMNPVGSHNEVRAFSTIGVCSKLMKLAPGEVFHNRGDCVRDYIHIMDLVEFHADALEAWDSTLFSYYSPRVTVLDVGTGVKTTVSQLLAIGWPEIATEIVDRQEHEGYDTTGTSDSARNLLPVWWNRKKRTLHECLEDYIFFSSTAAGGRGRDLRVPPAPDVTGTGAFLDSKDCSSAASI